MEKILPGVYKLRLGEPEAHTYETYREFPAKAYGGDLPAPVAAGDVKWSAAARGMMVSLPLAGEVYGFGLQLKAFRHTKRKRIMRNNADAPSDDGESHAPVPFYVTTEGLGVLVDCARDVAFYCGQSRERGESRDNPTEFIESLTSDPAAYEAYMRRDQPRMVIDIPLAQGVDIYFFVGEDMLEAVQKYIMFSGGGAKVPEWGLGGWYRMDARSTAEEWVRFAEKFREEDMDITVLGLEPGWQTHAYACTFVFDDKKVGDHAAAVRQMHALSYKVNLWEHCFTHPDSPIYDALTPYSGSHEVWGGLVPDFALQEARDIFAAQQQGLGVDCFKLDECDGSDHTLGWSFPDGAQFPSGMDGEQMHHLLGMLYQQTMNRAFPGSYHSVRASSALSAPYPFVLYSDLYAHEDFIRGMATAGFSGLLWAPEVRHAENVRDLIRRMQTALFSPQMLVNAWYLKNPPWEQIDKEKNNRGERMAEAREATDLVRRMFKERTAWIPYFMEMFEKYQRTGKPVFRALVLDYPKDENTYAMDDQYLVGDAYLFAPLTAKSDSRRVYLPGGAWTRNGVRYEAGYHECTCPLDAYLLFEKAGE